MRFRTNRRSRKVRRSTRRKRGGANLPVADISTLKPISLIVESGGGDIYRTNNPEIVYKALKGDVPTIISNITQKANSYVMMAASENLTPPLSIITEHSVPIGYTMQNLNGYTDVNSQQGTLQLRKFLKILKGILKGFKDIKNANLFPCPEHGGNILIKEDGNDLKVKIIDLDDIEKCNGQTDLESLKQLEIVFMRNRIRGEQPFLNPDRIGDLKWNTEINSIDFALAAVESLI